MPGERERRFAPLAPTRGPPGPPAERRGSGAGAGAAAAGREGDAAAAGAPGAAAANSSSSNNNASFGDLRRDAMAFLASAVDVDAPADQGRIANHIRALLDAVLRPFAGGGAVSAADMCKVLTLVTHLAANVPQVFSERDAASSHGGGGDDDDGDGDRPRPMDERSDAAGATAAGATAAAAAGLPLLSPLRIAARLVAVLGHASCTAIHPQIVEAIEALVTVS